MRDSVAPHLESGEVVRGRPGPGGDVIPVDVDENMKPFISPSYPAFRRTLRCFVVRSGTFILPFPKHTLCINLLGSRT